MGEQEPKLKPSELSKRSIGLADLAARQLKHDFLGTEHLLLGLINPRNTAAKGRPNLAIQVLGDLGLDINDLKISMTEVIQSPTENPPGEGSLPVTSRFKTIWEIAIEEAMTRQATEVDPEHILLAIAKEAESAAAQVLGMYDIDYSKIDDQLKKID